MKNVIPQEIKDAIDKVAKDYSRSEHTTNAGRWLRFVARFISVDCIIKIFAHKLG
jgi:hypothetical protein